ncbi:hypothetical protein ACH42_02345 [Endozoicomonas sp. (ex Bugula neritina AB1)]|nr:hypothetical protein ACH42_02345 [Endozoicomonas sp. (ex Bugula neritina AB1)]
MFSRLLYCGVLVFSLCSSGYLKAATQLVVIAVDGQVLLEILLNHREEGENAVIEIRSRQSIAEEGGVDNRSNHASGGAHSQPLVSGIYQMAHYLAESGDALTLELVEQRHIRLSGRGRSILLTQRDENSQMNSHESLMADSEMSNSSEPFEIVEASNFNQNDDNNIFDYWLNMGQLLEAGNQGWFFQTPANPLKIILSLDVIQLGNDILADEQTVRASDSVTIDNHRLSNQNYFQIERCRNLYGRLEGERCLLIDSLPEGVNYVSQEIYSGDTYILNITERIGFSNAESRDIERLIRLASQEGDQGAVEDVRR